MFKLRPVQLEIKRCVPEDKALAIYPEFKFYFFHWACRKAQIYQWIFMTSAIPQEKSQPKLFGSDEWKCKFYEKNEILN